MDNFDKYLDSKIRKSDITRTSDNFTRQLMNKIQTDFAVEAELRKSDRAANYIMGFFASLMVIITVTAGYFYFSAETFYSDTGTGYFETFLIFIQTLPSRIASILGFNQVTGFVNIIVLLIISSTLYLLADRLIIKRKI